jgi:hypothetical protein
MLLFVDSVGGGLASLAASVALKNGVEARASTSAAALVPRHELGPVLQEIGATQVAPSLQGGSPESAAIVIGAGGTIDARLYEGPDPTAFGPAELERLALARIARAHCLQSYSRSQSRAKLPIGLAA